MPVESTKRKDTAVFGKTTLSPMKPRPLVSVKDVFWILYLYPIRLLVRTLPLGFSRGVIRMAEPLFQYAHRRRKRTVERLLCKATGLQTVNQDVRRVARRFVGNAVVRAIDDLVLDQLADAGKIRCKSLAGEIHLKKALEAGRGLIVVTGHFYANRAAKRYLRSIGYPIASLRNFKPLDGLMGRLGEKVLQPRYIRFLHDVIGDELDSQAPDVSLQLLRRLRSGGAMNIHIDTTSVREELILNFLGRRSGFPTGMLEVIRLSGCAVLPMLCLGNSQDLTITFGEPFEIEPADTRKEFVALNLPKFVRNLETQVLTHPDQWEHWQRL